MKRLTALTLAGIMAAASPAAVFASSAPEEVQEAAVESVEEAAKAAPSEFEEKLRALDGVVSVTPIEVKEENQAANRFQERYVVEFEQQIDWANPEEGTFTQRALVGYNDTADVTCYYSSGYCLNDKLIPEGPGIPNYLETFDARPEYTDRYDCNCVALEYRFFGDSTPEGLSFDDLKYWEFLTSENASNDFHHIITELDKVLGGSSVFYGESKGGYTTENMAYYFPDDIDAYVSYVAPLCDGPEDGQFYENVLNTIGDKDPLLGEDGAEHTREMLESFQLILLDPRVRGTIQSMLMDRVAASGGHISPLVTEDEVYEVSVAELSASLWQMLPLVPSFEPFEQIYAMPDQTDEEFIAKAQAIAGWFFAIQPEMIICYDNSIAPYYYQSFTEMGNYSYNFSSLREAGAELTVLPEEEDELYVRLAAPIVVENGIEYDGTHREEMINFMNTTDKDLIKVVGYSDPWYAMKAPETENEHIHLFEVSGNHSVGISMMEPEAQAECYELLDSLLGK